MTILVFILAIATLILLGIVFAALFKVAAEEDEREWPIVRKIEEQTERGLIRRDEADSEAHDSVRRDETDKGLVEGTGYSVRDDLQVGKRRD